MPKGGKTFTNALAEAKFELQEGVCAACGKRLNRRSRTQGETGAWHAHHIQNRTIDQSIENCAVVCINGKDGGCHLAFAHLGDTRGPTMPKEDFQYLWSPRASWVDVRSTAKMSIDDVVKRGTTLSRIVWIEGRRIFLLADVDATVEPHWVLAKPK